jgi:hypothetical protein
MKPQDILFFIVLLSLFFIKRKPKIFIAAGLGCLLVAVPLFAFHIFFSAERMVWYAAGFILAGIILSLFKNK